ncbi:hypothetical protein [Quadrisphaera setariae]|uniref:O-antigen ligase n=1 Tax=Quadrisphaera setariae TaxID=2593304 RepID=A0A5C8ZFT5_9ACTN|nr:hypothetical protein [Quadrisphaera setariae]TXR56374.1 hypothetical protein FMM08_09740 [Quadrisphaera setariae]
MSLHAPVVLPGGPAAPRVAGRRGRRRARHLPAAWPLVLTGPLVTLASVVLAGRTGPMTAVLLALVATGAVSVVLCRDPARRAERALVFSAVMWAAMPATRMSGGTPLQLMMVGGAGLTLAVLLGRGTVKGSPWVGAVLALFAVMLASTAASHDQGAGFRLLLTVIAVLPALSLPGALDARGRRTVVASLVALGVVQGVVAAVEPTLFPEHLWVPAQRGADGLPVPLLNELLGNGVERSQGTLGHPLPLGLVLVASVALTVRGMPGLRWGVRLVLLVPLFAGLVAAGARASFLLAVVVVVVFGGRRTTVERVYLAVAAAALGGVALSAATPPSLGDTAESGSVTHRLGALTAAQELLARQDLVHVLFGNGFGSIGRMFDEGLLQDDGLRAIDNQFVSVLVQGGLAAVVLFSAVVVASVAAAPPTLRPALVSCVASLFLFDVLAWPAVAFVIFLLMGLATTRAADDGAVPVPSSGPPADPPSTGPAVHRSPHRLGGVE